MLAKSLISIFYEGTQPRLWSICHAKAPPIILITVSVSNTRGRKKPFSTLLILSFTLATSTLVLRGILVLVRRILNSGTLKVNQRVHTDILFIWFADAQILPSFTHHFLFTKLVLNKIKSELLNVNTCSMVLSFQPRISACHLCREIEIIELIIRL